jgi:two-component system, OmpR family, osmolarity sensor histidine kinase EnvZ
MRLAVEMLPADAAPQLSAQLQQDIEQMNALIGALLDLSRGLGNEEKQSVDVGELLNELAEEMRRSGAAVEYRAAPPCRVVAAPLALRRILVNLLDNAVRYGDGKPVEIRCELDGATRISILDHGPGIPAQLNEAVFQPFYRLETSRNTATGGSGLGLAIARQLAQSNGWEVELLPRPEGGTEARLTLG